MIRKRSLFCTLAFGLLSLRLMSADSRPDIVLVMADDMGWGETGYYGHPVLKTPNIDAMAANGLRFDRFYAGAPVCSPTRASVLTGRVNDRAGVVEQGYALRLQEKTLVQALGAAGYATGHFGKWHLDGLKGPGVPILRTDPHHPGIFGFDEWLSTTNFFDLDPLLSRRGKIEEFHGDSCDIVVSEALDFMERKHVEGKPVLAVIWYGSPHKPFAALPQDKAAFASLDAESAEHFGELVALDRSIGTLRRRLRELGRADNTLVIFCSDNGGLPDVTPATVGGLRGFKGSLYEGGLRVPAIVEWPKVITGGRTTRFPACTLDIFPTVAEVVGLPRTAMLDPIDGMSLRSLFSAEMGERAKPIPFRFLGRMALVDNRFKLLVGEESPGRLALYDLENDASETHNIAGEQPDRAERMRQHLATWSASVEDSIAGKDYPGGRVSPPDPVPVSWSETPAYRPYLEQWKQRPEYRALLRARNGAKVSKGEP